jgi:hypothetical protein
VAAQVVVELVAEAVAVLLPVLADPAVHQPAAVAEQAQALPAATGSRRKKKKSTR